MSEANDEIEMIVSKRLAERERFDNVRFENYTLQLKETIRETVRTMLHESGFDNTTRVLLHDLKQQMDKQADLKKHTMFVFWGALVVGGVNLGMELFKAWAH